MPKSTSTDYLYRVFIVNDGFGLKKGFTVPVILLRYCLVDLGNVNKLEKVSFKAERAQVNRVQLNVICWLSKTRIEKPEAPVYWVVITKTFHPLGQTPFK